MPISEESAAAFAALAAELHAQLHAEPSSVVTSRSIVDRTPEWVPEAEYVSLTLRVSRGFRTLASTHDVAMQSDALQYALREGPCVEASSSSSWIRSGHVVGDERWPRWGPRAGELGIRSLLSVQMLGSTGPVGALNMYSGRAGAFADRDQVDQGLIYATHAANALTSARLVEDLHTAMTSRHAIGMAQGILMERYGLGQDQSFELLRRLSSTSNTKLRDVATHVVRTRQLPPEEHRESPTGTDPSPV